MGTFKRYSVYSTCGDQMGEEITTIQVSTKTRDELKEIGKKGETYDEIVKNLLQVYKKNCKKG